MKKRAICEKNRGRGRRMKEKNYGIERARVKKRKEEMDNKSPKLQQK